MNTEKSSKDILIKLNPFVPDKPAALEVFVGREQERKQIINSLFRTYKNSSENILIKGERGIGKTSLALLTEYLSTFLSEIIGDKEIKYFTVFVSLGQVKSVEDIAIKILESCYRKLKESQNKVYENIKGTLKNIKGFSIGGYGIQFDFKEDPKSIYYKFDSLLIDLWEKLKNKFTAMLIIIDETDVISNDKQFPSFFKSIIESLNHEKIGNIMFLLTATPMGISNFIKNHQAFLRLFRIIEISNLNRDESDSLIEKALEKGQPLVKADKGFLNVVFKYSDGYPCFIHEICYSAFEVNNDEILDRIDFINGIVGTSSVKGAIINIFDKHFRQRYTEDILSNSYRDILHILASFNENEIKSSEIQKKFKGNKNTCSTYLSRMVERGIIKKCEGKKGYYCIPESMFKLWLNLSKMKKEP